MMTMRRAMSALATWLLCVGAIAAPIGTAFTYQGELEVAGAPANGAFDFEFALYDAAEGGTQIATVLRGDAAVQRGLFAVELDFTDAPFAAAQEFFLEVRVRAGADSGAYTALGPRQKITPAPYALNARTVQAGAVATTQLGDLAVTGAKIANATISAAKLDFTPGDITAVTAGTGLTGGATSGAATLAVNTGAIQARVTGSCAIGSFVSAINADGTVVCAAPPVTTAFADFYALMPPDNAATVAPGGAVDFPQDGPGSGGIVRVGADSFLLPSVGTYQVLFEVSTSEPGQLIVVLNGIELAYTVVGRATGTSQIVGVALVEPVVPNSVLSIRNPAGNTPALTITPLAGGTRPVAAHLVITRLR